MLTPRQEVARERRRMMQVRGAFDAALADPLMAGERRQGFCLACADYLVFSMDRLHAQDQVIQDLLGQRLPAGEEAARRQLAEIGQQQSASRDLVDELRRLAAELRRAGAAGVAAFEAGARRFAADLQALVQPRRNPLSPWTDRLFGDEDWARVAGVTPASLAREDELFQAVRRSAPPEADPERMSGGHPVAREPAAQSS